MTTDQINKGIAIAQALEKVVKEKGLPVNKLGLLMLQVAHETGGFNSHVSDVLNMSGIKWNPKGKIVKGEYDSGIKSPEGNNYSGFDTVESWANRYTNIIGGYKTKPLDANNVADFALRLKKSGYFTAPLDDYTHGLNSWTATLKKYIGKIPFPVTIAAGSLVVLLIVSLLIINQ